MINQNENVESKIAFLISRVLGPIPLLCILWLLTALKSGIGFWKALWVYPIIFIVSLGIPTLITTYLIASKKVKDIEWSNLEDRKKYLMPITLVALALLVIQTKLFTNQTIFHLSLLLCAIVGTIMLIYSFLNFKISAHIAIATITFAAINLFFKMQFPWLFLLIIPIMWARFVLKVHSLPQLLAGFLLPSAYMLVSLWLFGWPRVP